MTEEHKRKISESNKGKIGWNRGIPHSLEWNKNISEGNKGKKLSYEHIQKIKLNRLGKIPSPESIQKGLETKRKNGYKHSTETKEKIKQSLMGHEVSEQARNKIGLAFKDKKYEDFMSLETAQQRKKQLSERWKGENNIGYIDGKKLEYDYKKFNNRFKNLIRKRDNQICMLCLIHREKSKKALDVHHIDYDERNTIPQNCISLCRKCHGKTQFNREQWKPFFQNLLLEKYHYQYSSNGEVIIKLEGVNLNERRM